MAMNPGMKMLMMDKVRQHPENNYRSEYGGDSERRMIGYDRDYQTENRRRRDSRGRYMEGDGWEPHNRYEPESRRRRDSRGRYMMDAEYDDDEEEMRSQTWYPPHMMGGSGSRYGFGDVYAHIQAPNAMNRPGMMDPDMSAPIDEHTARMWVNKMDGGEKFKPDQAEQLRAAHCPECERWEFYTALNAMYSDYCEAAQKMGADRPEFYAYMAKGFLKDKDAKPHKLRRYMEHIAK